MKKAIVTVMVVIGIIATAAVASAERGNIGGITPTERGCIGGVGCYVAK